MKKLLSIFAIMFSSLNVYATTYINQELSIIRSPDTRPCMLFQLVSVPDAGGSGNPWFALKQNHIAYNEIVSMLLAAKMGMKKVSVSTNDKVVAECGHVEVTVVSLP